MEPLQGGQSPPFFVEAVRKAALAGPSVFNHQAGVLLGLQISQESSAPDRLNLATMIQSLATACTAGTLSFQGTPPETVGEVVQNLRLIKTYLKDPQFQTEERAKSVIGDIKRVIRTLCKSKPESAPIPPAEATLSPKVVALVDNVKAFWSLGYIKKNRLENSPPYHAHRNRQCYSLSFENELAQSLDDGSLEVILRDSRQNLLDVTNFDFSRCPLLSDRAPALLLEYCINFRFTALAEALQEPRFIKFEVKVGERTYRTNRALLVQESVMFKNLLEDTTNQDLDVNIGEFSKEQIDDFFGALHGTVDLYDHKVTLLQLFEVACVFEKFDCPKLLPRCIEAITWSAIPDAASCRRLLQLYCKKKQTVGLAPIRKDIEGRGHIIFCQLLVAAYNSVVASSAELPTPQQFAEVYVECLLQLLQEFKETCPLICLSFFKSQHSTAEEWGNIFPTVLFQGTARSLPCNVLESSRFPSMVIALEELVSRNAQQATEQNRAFLKRLQSKESAQSGCVIS